MLTINRAGWDQVAARYYGAAALPCYGPLTPTEESLHLLDSLSDLRVLELGCGSGHSLHYMASGGAAELWGLDLSATQIGYAAEVLQTFQTPLRLFESPMEVNPGLPTNYFDLVLSLWALGWTTDLPATLRLVAAYLKPGGCFIFSGEHPVYSCLRYEDRRFVFAQPYATQSPAVGSWHGVTVVRHQRTLSTFINEVVRAGLQIERLVESELNALAANEDQLDPARWYSVPRAQLMPTTFIVKARKPSRG